MIAFAQINLPFYHSIRSKLALIPNSSAISRYEVVVRQASIQEAVDNRRSIFQKRVFRIGFYTNNLNDFNKNFRECISSVIAFSVNYPGLETEVIIVGELSVDLVDLHTFVPNCPASLTVKRLGFLSTSDMAHLFFSYIDVFMTVSHYETFSQISSESLAFGVPVITFDDIGPADYVLNYETGLVVDRRIPNSVLRALEVFVHSPALQDRSLVRRIHSSSSEQQPNSIYSYLRLVECL